MPLFEYRCKKCGNTFEELVWGDRDRPIPCPHCGNQATEKLISVIGGIALGRSSSPACDAGCPGVASCASAGSGCCPHAG